MLRKIIIVFALIIIVTSCQEKNKVIVINTDDVFAWCIVPFDSLKRSPQERINMLKELGIKKYAYDWRKEHLYEMADELILAKKQDIEINAVWMWVNNSDSILTLSGSNEKVLKAIKEANYTGQIWVGFNADFYKNLTEDKAVEKGVKIVGYLNERAKALNCRLALYNHGDWFGEPANQVKVIKSLPNTDIGIIYNYHHAHHQIKRFSEVVDVMLPYLWGVNLNGMNATGDPKIAPIGTGDYELEMTQLLIDKGYKGEFGIIGHVRKDIKPILQANLEGLKKLNTQIKPKY